MSAPLQFDPEVFEQLVARRIPPVSHRQYILYITQYARVKSLSSLIGTSATSGILKGRVDLSMINRTTRWLSFHNPVATAEDAALAAFVNRLSWRQQQSGVDDRGRSSWRAAN
jgi:hypothetical protein